jgi:hypothetical protein
VVSSVGGMWSFDACFPFLSAREHGRRAGNKVGLAGMKLEVVIVIFPVSSASLTWVASR